MRLIKRKINQLRAHIRNQQDMMKLVLGCMTNRSSYMEADMKVIVCHCKEVNKSIIYDLMEYSSQNGYISPNLNRVIDYAR